MSEPGAVAAEALPPRPVASPPPGEGRRLAPRYRRLHRDPRPARRRRPRLVFRPVGPDQGGPARLHHRGARLPDGADDLRRALVLRDPVGRLPGRGAPWPIVTAYAVGVAMNNFLPANIGTFVTLVMFVALIPDLHDRRFDRRVSRAEDLLHDRRHVRLPVPVPVGAGVVRPEPRATSRPIPGSRSSIVVGGRLPDRRSSARDLLAAGEEAVGTGEAGWRDPLGAEALPDAGVPAVVPLVRRASSQ